MFTKKIELLFFNVFGHMYLPVKSGKITNFNNNFITSFPKKLKRQENLPFQF